MVGQLICNSLYTYFGPGRLYRIIYFTYFRKFLLSSPCGGGLWHSEALFLTMRATP